MTPEESAGTELAAAVAAIVEPVFASLEEVAALVVEVGSSRPDGLLTEAVLQPVEELLIPLASRQELVAGTGFVADAGAVSGHERFMSWWQRRGDRVSRLRLNFDPRSVDVYDYLQMEWFQQARSGQQRVAYGPYVDYSGSGLYTVTVTVPVQVEGRFVGVVGADLVVDELERRLVAALRRSDREAVLVGAERRVLAANTPRWVVGTRLPHRPSVGGQYAAVVPVPRGPGWVVGLAADPDVHDPVPGG